MNENDKIMPEKDEVTILDSEESKIMYPEYLKDFMGENEVSEIVDKWQDSVKDPLYPLHNTNGFVYVNRSCKKKHKFSKTKNKMVKKSRKNNRKR